MREQLANRVFTWLMLNVMAKRPPDFIVGATDDGGAYLHRWYLTPWRGWFQHIAPAQRTRWQRAVVWLTSRLLPNLYVHHFLRDDDDRALHDHPSWAVSFLLRGRYIEHTIAEGGIHARRVFRAGDLRFMSTHHAHRIELPRVPVSKPPIDSSGTRYSVIVSPCFTLFLFGPRRRDWGFHCPERGWVPWQEFTAAGKPGEVGRGCE